MARQVLPRKQHVVEASDQQALERQLGDSPAWLPEQVLEEFCSCFAPRSVRQILESGISVCHGPHIRCQ